MKTFVNSVTQPTLYIEGDWSADRKEASTPSRWLLERTVRATCTATIASLCHSHCLWVN